MDNLIFGYIGWLILVIVMVVLIYTGKKEIAKPLFFAQFVIFTILLALTLFKVLK